MDKILNFEDEAIQYIEITDDMQFRDFSGRFTDLLKGSRGAVLTSENIPSIWGITEEKVILLKDRLEQALNSDCILALVSGYPCLLRKQDYKFIKRPQGMLPVPWEIF